jgi:hypothetical protein
VNIELTKDVLNVVSHRSLTDKKLFRNGRRGCAGPHQGHDLQFPSGQFTDWRYGLLARRELSLSQLLANKHFKLMRRGDITEEVDNRGGLVVLAWKSDTTHIDPQRFARPRPCSHLKMLDQVSATQRHLEWAGPLTQLIAVAVTAVEELAALLSDDLFCGSFQDSLSGFIAEQYLP